MIYPQRLKGGQTPTARDWNLLVAAVMERTPLGGINTMLKPGPDGFRLNAQKGGGGGPAAAPYDFQLIDASSLGAGGTGTGPTSGQLQVRCGNFSGATPTGMTPGDVPGFYLQLTSNGANPIYIIGKIAVSGDGTWGACTVYQSTSTFTADGSYIYVQIGTCQYDGASITNISNDVKGSLSAYAVSSADGTVLNGVFNPVSWT